MNDQPRDPDEDVAPPPSNEPPKSGSGAGVGNVGQNAGETGKSSKPNSDENGGKNGLSDEPARKPFFQQAEARESEDKQFSFEPLEMASVGRRSDDALSPALAQDIAELGLGFVVLAHRPVAETSEKTSRGVRRTIGSVAGRLAAEPFWSSTAVASSMPGFGLVLKRAVEAMIGATDGKRRVFAAAVDAKNAEDMNFFAVDHRPALQELDRWLQSANVVLIVCISLPQGFTRRRMANTYPEFYWLPWHAWLDDLVEKTEVSVEELGELFQSTLGELLEKQDSGLDRREQIIHAELRNWFVSAPDKAADEDEVKQILTKAAEAARSGAVDRGKVAREHVRQMFGLEPPSATSAGSKKQKPIGEIESIVLSVWALLDDVDFNNLMAVVRALLPLGEAAFDQLTPELHEAWEIAAKDDQRRNRDTRPAADWRQLFDARRTKLLWSAGLKCVDDMKVVARSDFEKGDVLAVLAKWPEFLETLLDRIRAGDLLQLLPHSASLTLIRMLAAIRKQAPSLINAEDFVLLATGLGPSERRMAIPSWVLAECWDQGLKILAELIGPNTLRRLGDAKVLVEAHRNAATGMEAFGEGVDDFEDELLLGTVNAFRTFLETFMARSGAPSGFVDDCLDLLVDRSHEQLRQSLVAISCLVILGPAPSDARLGEATFRIMRAAVPHAEWPSAGDGGQEFFELFDAHLRRTLNSIGPSESRSVDRWADAVATVSAKPHARPWQKAVASYMDDAIARHDIPWGNANRRPLDAPILKPLLAPQFLDAYVGDLGRSVPDLLERLFSRAPGDHLQRLVEFAQQGDESFFAAIERRLVDLLSETYWVLSDEIDRDEVDRRPDVIRRMSSEIWGGITAVYGLDPARDARGAAALILSRIDQPPESPDHLPIALLDLFAPTVLLHWRFRMFPPGRLSAENTKRFIACLDRVLDVVGERREALHRAFQAMEMAEDRLVELFEANDCLRTAARHRDRRNRIKSLVNYFSKLGPLAVAQPSE